MKLRACNCTDNYIKIKQKDEIWYVHAFAVSKDNSYKRIILARVIFDKNGENVIHIVSVNYLLYSNAFLYDRGVESESNKEEWQKAAIKCVLSPNIYPKVFSCMQSDEKYIWQVIK